jgi:hypothetical protein
MSVFDYERAVVADVDGQPNTIVPQSAVTGSPFLRRGSGQDQRLHR